MDSIALGRFAVRPDGALSPRGSPPPALDFAWRGRRCRAELAAEGAVRLTADAARIPSTAEPGADRRRAFAALAELPGMLPGGWQARLLADHRVSLEAETALGGTPNTTALVAAMVRFVLELDPYLDRLEAEGVGPSGRANI